MMHAMHSRAYQIAAVWHPEAEGDVLTTNLGNIRVQVGEARYQLCTGGVVSL